MAVADRNRLRVSAEAPQNLVADNAYDSDRPDGELGSAVLNSSLRIARIDGTRPNKDVG